MFWNICQWLELNLGLRFWEATILQQVIPFLQLQVVDVSS